jgi:SAM-dependent methyltransferase
MTSRFRCTAALLDADVDITQAASARVCDYFLGDAHNFTVDRRVAGRMVAAVPDVAKIAWANRAFLDRAVRHVVQAGVTQILDLGCGLLTRSSVHGLLQDMAPQTRVVHVDRDPVAVAFGAHQVRLTNRADQAGVLCADIAYPWMVLSSEPFERLLDLGRPVAIIATNVLHHLPDQADPAAVLAEYRDAAVAGSYLVLSHLTADGRAADMAALVGIAASADIDMTPRSRTQVRRLFSGFRLVRPGLVWAPTWRPDENVDARPSHSCLIAGVGQVPHSKAAPKGAR